MLFIEKQRVDLPSLGIEKELNSCLVDDWWQFVKTLPFYTSWGAINIMKHFLIHCSDQGGNKTPCSDKCRHVWLMKAGKGKFFLLHNQMWQSLDINDFLDLNLAKNIWKQNNLILMCLAVYPNAKNTYLAWLCNNWWHPRNLLCSCNYDERLKIKIIPLQTISLFNIYYLFNNFLQSQS